MLSTQRPSATRRTPCPGCDADYLAKQEDADAKADRFDAIADRAEADFLRALRADPAGRVASPWDFGAKCALAEVVYANESQPAEAAEIVAAMSLVLRGDEAGALAKLREAVKFAAQRYADTRAELEA